MWHGEAFYGLGVQVVKVLILLGALFLPSGSSVSARFLIHGAHSVFFCAQLPSWIESISFFILNFFGVTEV
jgi:hypothetical protein